MEVLQIDVELRKSGYGHRQREEVLQIDVEAKEKWVWTSPKSGSPTD